MSLAGDYGAGEEGSLALGALLAGHAVGADELASGRRQRLTGSVNICQAVARRFRH